ncbi:MAG: DUF3991 and TOPRIM domain-containing protein, partial [Lachnospiraceae bacterium]|nr:DUF3991 and TOPRIM domain-containing protein [Lachnospiraceae bacterium]
KCVDLCDVAASLGYTVRKIGRYHTLKEMDSIRIYDRKSWYRWSMALEGGNNGGSQIDFLMVFAGMDIKEAVFWLLDFAGYRRFPEHNMADVRGQKKLIHMTSNAVEEKKEFVLPIPSGSNSFLYAYLTEDRCIDKRVVDFFVQKNLIYESRGYHNIVFRGNDKSGVTRFASQRGVFDKNGRPFKCDVAGNDKNFGFNVVNEENHELYVFEAAIDLMSYMDLYDDFESNKLALGMLHDAPIVTFLKEHPQITTIKLCLDNDGPGRAATEKFVEKYQSLKYNAEDFSPPSGYKDYNEWLQEEKRSMVVDYQIR